MKKAFNTRFQLDWVDRVNAKRILDVYPEVSLVHIKLTTHYFEPVVFEYDLHPEDPLHLSVPCPNLDCTSKFILTNQLIMALKTKTVQKDVIFCDGRETNKPGAYSCSAWLEYSIIPFLR